MSKNESKIITISIIVVILIAIGGLVYAIVNSRITKENVESVIEESLSAEQSAAAEHLGDPAGDDNPQFETANGENGGEETSNYEGGFDSGPNGASKSQMVDLAIHYNKSVPFLLDGYDESLVQGYVTGQAIDNYNLGEKAHGMTNMSYLVWIFRNTFGVAPVEFDDFSSIYGKGQKITAGELKIGDIGMFYPEGEDNLYGVCIGTFNGHPLFSYCANVPTVDFPAGCNHISYLLSDTESYFNGSAPVDFRYFVRLPLSWKEVTK